MSLVANRLSGSRVLVNLGLTLLYVRSFDILDSCIARTLTFHLTSRRILNLPSRHHQTTRLFVYRIKLFDRSDLLL